MEEQPIDNTAEFEPTVDPQDTSVDQEAAAAAEQLEAERIAAEQAIAQQAEAERIAAEQVIAQQAEAERLAAEQLEAERLAAERLAAEQLEAERLAAEKAQAEAESIRPVKELINEIEEKLSSQNITMNVEAKTIEPVPKLVFIVPYRNRESQKKVFDNIMPTILEDIPSTDYKIYFIQQCDVRDFNRGAMKNIGFLAMKNKYPNDYKNITFIFNDVDTMPPTKNLIDYNTLSGVIKHFYGQTNTLGGIVSIKGEDFEKTQGYPNFWAWGYEDNLLQYRAIQSGLTIDRSQFFKTGDTNILQLNETTMRVINRNEFNRYITLTTEGYSTIKNLRYDIDENNRFIHVTKFDTGFDNIKAANQMYDLRNGNTPFTVNTPMTIQGRRRGSAMGMHKLSKN